MKFTIGANALADIAKRAAAIAPAKSGTPTLTLIRITASAEKGTVRLDAFDGERTLRIAAPAEVEQDGEILVSRDFASITGALNGETATVTTEGMRVLLRSGSSRFTLASADPSAFAVLPGLPPTIGYVNTALLHEAVLKVAPAADTDSTKGAQYGIRLRASQGELLLAATDTRRLAEVRIPWTAQPELVEVEVIIPHDDLKSAVNLFSTETVGLAAGTDGLGLFSPQQTLRLPVISATYPDYASRGLIDQVESTTSPDGTIVPADSIAFTRTELVAALKIAALVLKATGDREVRLRIVGPLVTVESGAVADGAEADTDSGSSTEIAVARRLDTDALLAFNVDYLATAVNLHSGTTVSLQVIGNTNPVLITGDAGYKHVVMPIRRS